MSDPLQNYFLLAIAELEKLAHSLHSLRAASEHASSTLTIKLLEASYLSLSEEIAQINLKMSNLNHFVTTLKHPHLALSLTDRRQHSPKDLAYWTNGRTEQNPKNGDQSTSLSSTRSPSFLTRPTTGPKE